MAIVQTGRKDFVYRYKLSDNCKEEQRQIAGITLTKNWTDFRSQKEQLIPFIKSPSRLDGLLDFEKKDLISNEIVIQSTYTGETPDIISRETLNAMERFELVPIAKYYEIDVVQKDKNMLIKMITERQNKRIEYESKKEDKVIEKDNTNIIINHTEQNPQQYFNEDDIEKKNGWFGFGSKK